MRATDRGRQLAERLADLMAGEPEVTRSEWRGHTVDVLVGDNAPAPGVTTLASLNLSDVPVIIDGQDQDFGLELLLSCPTSREDGPDVLLDAAFLYLNGEELYPGAVLPDLVKFGHLKHLFFITSYLWDQQLRSISVDGTEIRFLQGVPISDEELAVVGTEGAEALDALFEQAQIDIFDWSRPSVATL